MRREAFGPIAGLDDTELARVLLLAALGCTWTALRDGQPLPARALPPVPPGSRGPLQPLRLQRIEQFGVFARRSDRAEADQVTAAARKAWSRLQPGPGLLRLGVDLRRSGSDPARQVDPLWLTDLLVRGLGADRTVASAAWAPVAGRAYSWDWPLGTAVADAGGDPFFANLHQPQSFHYARFLAPVDLGQQPAACELLVVNGSLAQALGFAAGARLTASLVLVLGEPAGSPESTASDVAALGARLQSGAVALCDIEPARRPSWFTGFVEELSHNNPLDVALWLASQPLGRMRFVAGDGRFLALSSVAETAKRIAGAASLPPAQPGEAALSLTWNFTGRRPAAATRAAVARSMIENADRMQWDSEGGDATVLLEARAAFSDALGGLQPEGITSGPVPEPTGAEAVEPEVAAIAYRGVAAAGPGTPALGPKPVAAPRWVQADLYRLGDGRIASNRILASAPYTLHVRISPEQAAAIVAPVPLDEARLPPSATGHDLRIAFTPLWRTAPGAHAPAQVAGIHLPPTGFSTSAIFHFMAPPAADSMRARLVVLTGKRVLQTLLLSTQDGTREDDGSMKARLELENMVSADFGEASVAPEFGASIVLNHSPSGHTGITLVGEQVEFFEPAGIDQAVALARQALETLNAPDNTDDLILGLEDPRVHELMLKLAKYGQAIRSELTAQDSLLPLVDVARIQFVEARQRGYFPLEIVYDGKAPDDDATLCPNAAAALENQEHHRTCPNARSRRHYCPAAFWGLSKCIERHAENGRPSHRFAQPTRSDGVLKPFASALLAASNNVLLESLAPPAGLEGILSAAGMQLLRARNWHEWCDTVAEHAPATLVLLPHSLASALAALPALEIGGDVGEISGMDEDYVAPAGKHPLVLLLGCSTALTDVSFCNSISQFRRAGAAITLGTVALIRGRQAVLFVRELLGALREAARHHQTFDEALLKVKRRMLAQGDPFVFSLVCYGDSSWRIEP